MTASVWHCLTTLLQLHTKLRALKLSATYEVNGLTVGYAYASADAKDGNTTTHNGVHEGQSAVGASYAMGDLVVSVGKQNLKDRYY